METLPAQIKDLANPERFRSSVMALQAQMQQLPQVECPLRHLFGNGVYVREVTIPADTLVIGEIHRNECVNVLLKGEITVITEEGTRRLTAPATFVSPPLTKKAAYTHSEVVWSNVIATESCNVEEIEREHIMPDYGGGGAFAELVRMTAEKEGLCLS